MSNRKRFGVLTYESCAAACVRGNPTDARLTYKTWLRYEFGAYRLYHHTAPIVTFHADGAVVVDCAGHRSRTTLDRVRDATGANIYQRGGMWWYGDHPYFDGLNVGRPRNLRESIIQAASQGDEVAWAALADLDEEEEHADG